MGRDMRDEARGRGAGAGKWLIRGIRDGTLRMDVLRDGDAGEEPTSEGTRVARYVAVLRSTTGQRVIGVIGQPK